MSERDPYLLTAALALVCASVDQNPSRWVVANVVHVLRAGVDMSPQAVLEHASIFVPKLRGLEETAIQGIVLEALRKVTADDRRKYVELVPIFQERWVALVAMKQEQIDNLSYLLARVFQVRSLLGEDVLPLIDELSPREDADRVLYACCDQASEHTPLPVLTELFRRTLPLTKDSCPRSHIKLEALAAKLTAQEVPK